MNLSEIWKPVLGYEGLYEVSNLGRVRSVERDVRYSNGSVHHYYSKMLKLQKDKNKGYLRVCIEKEGVKKHHLIHRLVWEAFNGPIPNGLTVNHNDENKENNCLSNLCLMTPKEQSNWGTAIERRVKKLKGKKRTDEQKRRMSEVRRGVSNTKLKKAIQQFTLDMVLVREYSSLTEVGEILGVYIGNISSCCNGKQKSSHGSIWRYKN